MARSASYSYSDAGFNAFFRRTISSDPNAQTLRSTGGGRRNTLNFDNMQTAGSMGDKLTLGLITLNGKDGNITISDGVDIRAIFGADPNG